MEVIGQSFQLFRNVYLEKPLNVLQILSGNDLFQQIWMILQFKSVKLCRKYRWNVVYYNSEYIYTACVCCV